MGAITSYQSDLDAARAAAGPTPAYQERNVPPLPTPPSDLGQFAQSEQREASTIANPAQRAGRIARAVVQAPLVAAASALPDVRDTAAAAGRAVKGAGGAISDFARGVTGSTTPAPAAAPAPASPVVATTSPASDADYTSTVSPDEQKIAVADVAQPAAAPANSPAYSDAPARPSNVRAYLRVPQTPAAPTVDPEAFAQNAVKMGQVDPSASVGQAMDATVGSRIYRKAYLQALQGAQAGYTGETGRISANANANLSGAHAEEAGARTEDTQAGTAIKRYSLSQQQSLQDLTKKLADPKLTPEERRNLEMQLWILHGKPPRPDNRYEAVQGRVDPMTGTIQPGVILDRSTGQTQPLERGAAKPPSDPQAEARAAVASGADKAKVNQRLRAMGQPELQ